MWTDVIFLSCQNFKKTPPKSKHAKSLKSFSQVFPFSEVCISRRRGRCVFLHHLKKTHDHIIGTCRVFVLYDICKLSKLNNHLVQQKNNTPTNTESRFGAVKKQHVGSKLIRPPSLSIKYSQAKLVSWPWVMSALSAWPHLRVCRMKWFVYRIKWSRLNIFTVGR